MASLACSGHPDQSLPTLVCLMHFPHQRASIDSASMGNTDDKRLGLNDPITRRDFVNGAMVAGAALLMNRPLSGVEIADDWTGYGGVGDYRHANGNTLGVMNVAHAMRDGGFERRMGSVVDTGETYDLVAVGGGLSGLAAAVFFQQNTGGRCLVLDNHAIFGGEARRNEFLVDGQRVVAHQGSAIFLVPGKGGYTDRFYEMIGMDRRFFEYQRWRGPYPEMRLNHSPYGQPENFGFYFTPQFTRGRGVWVLDPWGRQLDGAPITA